MTTAGLTVWRAARVAVLAVLAYLLGFLALAVFAAYAFGAGASPSPERWVAAFKLGAVLAALEVAVLLHRAKPANRLILGANLWLLVGGLAAFAQQWWVLRALERMGEASLFACMLGVGAVATLASPAGFVAATGPRRRVLWASALLLMATLGALAVAVVYRSNARLAAVLPVIALSWLARGLRHWVARGESGGAGSP